MDEFVNLAKRTVEEYARNKKIIPEPKGLPPEFYSRQAGVFVTIFKGGELRGCIGTYRPVKKNLAEEIIANAAASCSQDNRFFPVAEAELAELNYEVSILSEPEEVEDLRRHNPKNQGIIVMCAGGRRGLLLPDIAGVDSTDQQIAIACQKGGIDPVKDQPSLYFFTVEKHI